MKRTATRDAPTNPQKYRPALAQNQTKVIQMNESLQNAVYNSTITHDGE